MNKIIKFGMCFSLLLAATNAGYSQEKYVYVNKITQTLVAYEGTRVVLKSPVSTGKASTPTPNGSFSVGIKKRMHYSTLYENSPMPFSVQFSNNYFIHGGLLPGYPASHGCVRMPVNRAEKLFNWITPGTPVIIGSYSKNNWKSITNNNLRKYAAK